MHLHETETPLMFEDDPVPVGYIVETENFTFTAIYDTDGTVNSYVVWADDQPGDMMNHAGMAEAKRWLETLLAASK